MSDKEWEWIDVARAAEITGYGVSTVRRWCNEGIIEAKRGTDKETSHWRVREKSIYEALAAGTIKKKRSRGRGKDLRERMKPREPVPFEHPQPHDMDEATADAFVNAMISHFSHVDGLVPIAAGRKAAEIKMEALAYVHAREILDG